MESLDYAVRDKLSQPHVRQPFRPERFYSTDKPKQCPRCRSVLIAELLYGEPGRSSELIADLKAGRVVPAGKTKSADKPDPRWKCLDCQTLIYHKES
ncbi:MAG TPA: hypothetical protein PLO24_01670 [Bacteroidales bacterium]|jgi:hypothetical protein|nr:hypothetical protein [Bacteroidales bacterium]HQH23699.1 hypothetical protein [Bacteroidales bacterium]HQJ82296.1 hypothetical protein [Bacteroidales bacterium]